MIGVTAASLSSESALSPFDCVVVGGGSSGLTVARTLAERDQRVAVLEAGPAPFLTNISNTGLRFSRNLTRQLRAAVQYSPRTQTGEQFGRNYGCLGGRGLFWNGSAPRFRDHDFTGWPFTAAELAEEFEWAENEFRVALDLGQTELASRMIERLQTAGYAAQPGPFALDLGGDPGQLAAGVGSGLGAFFRTAGDLVAAGKIQIGTQTLAQRVLWSGDSARGVVASGDDGASHEIRARSVVLAGGGVESIRLASISNVPDAGGQLGLGVQDHMFYRCYFEGPELYDPERAEVAAVFVPSCAQDTEQWELQAPGRRFFTLDDGAGWVPAPGPGFEVMIRSFAATEKRPENRVQASPGPLGSAVVHFEYSDQDNRHWAAIRGNALEVGAVLGLTLKDDRTSGPGGSYHEAGGLDMGTDPSTSVTDAFGRFHGVSNLLCIDAAAFPRIGATNPHVTIVAVARRQAVALAADLSS